VGKMDWRIRDSYGPLQQLTQYARKSIYESGCGMKMLLAIRLTGRFSQKIFCITSMRMGATLSDVEVLRDQYGN
jgi:hypothetical protein